MIGFLGSRKGAVAPGAARAASAAGTGPSPSAPTTKSRGDAAEAAALAYLQAAGLRLVARNYRTPGRGGGEIDLVMRERDGTLVFVEVRQRSGAAHGGAGASITARKQQRIVFAARHFLARLGQLPPCRFDVVLVEAQVQWLRGAFDAGPAPASRRASSSASCSRRATSWRGWGICRPAAST